jgi:NmrA-like family
MTEGAKPIFVVGGTGRHGGTGAFAARGLLAAGSPVRALARTRDSRSAVLEELGAEVVTGDLHDRGTLLPALQGIEIAFFSPNRGPALQSRQRLLGVEGRKRQICWSHLKSSPRASKSASASREAGVQLPGTPYLLSCRGSDPRERCTACTRETLPIA